VTYNIGTVGKGISVRGSIPGRGIDYLKIYISIFQSKTTIYLQTLLTATCFDSKESSSGCPYNHM